MKIERIEKLHGDASYRTYSRIFYEDGSTHILMQLPEGKSSASEEISNFSGKVEKPIFISINHDLAKAGLPVPNIVEYRSEQKQILLEDLGDELLGKVLEECSNSDARNVWYKRAIDLMVEMQNRMSRESASGSIALKRSFDATLLNWEFDHFKEYLLDARGAPLSKEQLNHFNRITRSITSDIEQMNYKFTHRDFQSRNLLVRKDQIFIIDFQDALTGPYVYDLVSLLRDSYTQLTENDLQELIEHFSQTNKLNYDEVRAHFDLVSIQRKMKDAGRFVYIDQVKGNSNYLQFIPRSLNYVRDALERLPKYSELIDIIKPNVPEWQ